MKTAGIRFITAISRLTYIVIRLNYGSSFSCNVDDQMTTSCILAQILGAALCLLGVAGIFMLGRPQDGALAVTGAILFAAGFVSFSILKSRR